MTGYESDTFGDHCLDEFSLSLSLCLVALSEPSFFQRFFGLFSSKDKPEIQFKTNDIEMTTFSVVSGQSPDVLMPAFCCSAAGRTPNGKGWFVISFL